METQWTRMTTNEAAEIIQHNDMVAFGGYPGGFAESPTTAIARRANGQHEGQKAVSKFAFWRVRQSSAAADDVLSHADAVSWRAPYQSIVGLRKKINQGAVWFVDYIWAKWRKWSIHGFFSIDVAVIEALSALARMVESG